MLQRKLLESEKMRFKTFRDWQETYHVSKEYLANEGFIHIGPGDKVQCFKCRGMLSGFEEGDDPKKEHNKHFPECKMFSQSTPARNQAGTQQPHVKENSNDRSDGMYDELNPSLDEKWSEFTDIETDGNNSVYYINFCP